MEKKSFLITEVLALLLGWLGVHRYYTGYIGLGVLQTLTLGGCGIWALIDFIFISVGKYKDAQGQELEDYDKNIGIGFLIFAVVASLVISHLPSNKTVINNNTNFTQTVSDKTEKTVTFGNTKCTVYSYGYSCIGDLSEEDKAKLKEIQAELKK